MLLVFGLVGLWTEWSLYVWFRECVTFIEPETPQCEDLREPTGTVLLLWAGVLVVTLVVGVWSLWGRRVGAFVVGTGIAVALLARSALLLPNPW